MQKKSLYLILFLVLLITSNNLNCEKNKTLSKNKIDKIVKTFQNQNAKSLEISDLSLFGLNENEITNFTYNKSTKKFEQYKSLKLKSSISKIYSNYIKRFCKIGKYNDYIIVRHGSNSYAFDKDLTSIEHTFKDTLKDFRVNDKYLYASIGGYGHLKGSSKRAHLCIFDSELKMISKLDSGIDKEIDNILIYKNIAYLLDDLMMPLYVLTADISDKANPKLIKTVKSMSVNAHLVYSWIFTKNQKWIVTEAFSHLGGWGHNFINYDINDIDNFSKIEGFISHRITKKSEKGIALLASDQINPIDNIWVIIKTSQDKNPSIAKAKYKNNEIIYEKLYEIKDYKFSENEKIFTMDKIEDYVIIITSENRILIYKNDKNSMNLILNQKFNKKYYYKIVM